MNIVLYAVWEDDGNVVPGSEIEPGSSDGTWAIINLVFAILSIASACAAIVSHLTRREGSDRTWIWAILCTILAIVSVAVFILTEDVTQARVMTDGWSVLMGVLFIATAALSLTGAYRDRYSTGPE